MRIFFRKHGNSLFYVFLPVFFLLVTVALIQFAPKTSKSDPGDTCDADEFCCNTSTGACGPEDALEACQHGQCIKTNVGCPNGFDLEQGNGDCTCTNGDQVEECIQCANSDEIVVDGVCTRACAAGEDPDVTGCTPLEGTGCGASLLGANVPPNYFGLWFFAVAGIYPMIRRKIKK